MNNKCNTNTQQYYNDKAFYTFLSLVFLGLFVLMPDTAQAGLLGGLETMFNDAKASAISIAEICFSIGLIVGGAGKSFGWRYADQLLKGSVIGAICAFGADAFIGEVKSAM